jgi:hypothetical protein
LCVRMVVGFVIPVVEPVFPVVELVETRAVTAGLRCGLWSEPLNFGGCCVCVCACVCVCMSKTCVNIVS